MPHPTCFGVLNNKGLVRILWVLFACLLQSPWSFGNDIGNIYYSKSNGDGIFRSKPDGTEEHLLFSGASARHLYLDRIANHLYWSDGSSIIRGSLDGSSQEVLLTDLSTADGWSGNFAIDPIEGDIFYTSQGHIMRFSIGSQSSVSVLEVGHQLRATKLEVDHINKQLYFGWDALYRLDSDLENESFLVDGSLNEKVHFFEGLYASPDVRFWLNRDFTAAFYNDLDDGQFKRYDLTTGTIETLDFEHDIQPFGGSGSSIISFGSENLLYYAGYFDEVLGTFGIIRYDISGDTGAPNPIVDGATMFVVDYSIPQLHLRSLWFAEGTSIYRADENGQNRQLVYSDVGFVNHLEVDSERQNIYWRSGSEIHKGRLDGAGSELVVGQLDEFGSRFTIDRTRQNLYYARIDFEARSTIWTRHSLEDGSEETVLSYPEANLTERVFYSPVLDTLLFGSESSLYWTNATSRELTLDSPALFPVNVAPWNFGYDTDGTLLLQEIDGEISRFDVPTEAILGNWEIGVSAPPHTLIRADESSGEIYFVGQDGIRKGSFGGLNNLVLPGVFEFALDVVEEESDVGPPTITLFSPAAGETNNRLVTISGSVSDNQIVGRVWWELNGLTQESFALLPGGLFGLSSIELPPGINVITILAEDLDGNRSSTGVTVTWIPDRTLSLGSGLNALEGDEFRVPVVLDSGGLVSGMTFEIAYDSVYLNAPTFEQGLLLDEAVFTANATEPGKLRVTFAKAGTTVLSGPQQIGSILFRARSIPNSLTTSIGLVIEDVSGGDGGAIEVGNIALGTELDLIGRSIIGDINTNGSLDLGDAFLMQRLLAGFEETRDWDDTLNDLNGNSILDSGDVVTVLRTIVGVLPQPQPLTQAVRSHRDHPRARLVLDKTMPSVGETVTVSVQVTDLGFELSGASFVIDYPTNAILLESPASHVKGDLVGGGGFVIWDVSPDNDYANQFGTIAFVASGSSLWPGSAAGGEIARLQFTVQDSVSDERVWPIALRQVTVPSEDGYDVVDLEGLGTSMIGQEMTYHDWTEETFGTAASQDPTISAWDADPDGDGNSNGQEYFQATSGAVADDAAALGALFVGLSGKEIPSIKIRQSLYASQVGFSLEISTDLETWQSVPSQEYLRWSSPTLGVSEVLIGPESPPDEWDHFFLRLVFSNLAGEF